VIEACFLVDVPGLLDAARARMVDSGRLREERFEVGELVPWMRVLRRKRGVSGGGISRRARVIFCDGVDSFSNPYFSRLPFAPNKGEALLVEIDGLAAVAAAGAQVFKKGLSIVPWRDGLFWVGSSYEWSFEHAEPTEVFRLRTEAALREWVKLPFRTVSHLAAVRPATLERRPFVGFHPLFPACGDPEWDGDEGVFIGAVFCAAAGGAFGRWACDIAGGGCAAV
jgi:hypothetical protein